VRQDKVANESLERVAEAADLLERGQTESAGKLADQTIEQLTGTLGPDWREVDITKLLSLLGSGRRAQALARALWIGSTVDEAAGRHELANSRCQRAMELYARLRMSIEELDLRAARELASLSRRTKQRS
jgi:hypothetical protein